MYRHNISLEIFGDRLLTTDVYDTETNESMINRMRETLKTAINRDLTDRQRTFLLLYMRGKKMTHIAAEYGICKSTVSRTITRAIEILKKSCRGGSHILW